MQQQNRQLQIISIIIFIPLVLCFIAVSFRKDYNIFMPINTIIAAGVLFYSYLKSKNSNYLLLAVSSCIFGICDSVWIYLELIHLDPLSFNFLLYVYLIPNLCLLIAFFTFAYHHTSKWDLVQLCLDTLLIGALNFLFIWLFVFQKDLTLVKAVLDSGITSLLSITIDVLLIIAVFSWLFSIRSGRIAFYDSVIFIGIILFAFIDIYFFYANFASIYHSNSLTDFCYILSFQTIAFGVSLKVYLKETIKNNSTIVTNIGNTSNWIFLFIYPIGAILLNEIHTSKLNLLDIFILFLLIIIYRTTSKYVQLNIQLLTQERHMNEILEERVAEQVVELTYLANRDTLTSLYNRRYFYKSVDESLKSLRESELLVLIIIDVDRFKKVNDNFGHDVGDEVLIELGARLENWNQVDATLCRLGGDEFAIMFTGFYTKNDIQRSCDDLIQLCKQPIKIEHFVLNMSVSVGVALYSEEANNRKTLMKNADLALYRAKSQGFNKYQFYQPLLYDELINSNKIEFYLRQVNVEKEFELYYQPQFSIPDVKLIGAEALIRWNHPVHGFIPPNIFIPIAEEIDQITTIGKWVIHQTLMQTAKWNEGYIDNIKVGFNVSVKQFIDQDFITFFKAALSELEVDPSLLDLELTESVMLSYGSDEILEQINRVGVSISIDDFGSGFSSLSYLSKYKFDRIKIDKTLIDELSFNNSNGINVVKAAISMAKAVGMKTLAEGVETKEQLEVLTSLGCDEVQGYFLGKPVPAGIFEQRFLKMKDSIVRKSLQKIIAE